MQQLTIVMTAPATSGPRSMNMAIAAKNEDWFPVFCLPTTTQLTATTNVWRMESMSVCRLLQLWVDASSNLQDVACRVC